MGWNDHIENSGNTVKEQCPKCGKLYLCYYEEQVPGFRMRDYKICPYCHEVLESSMEYEFSCSQIDDNNTEANHEGEQTT